MPAYEEPPVLPGGSFLSFSLVLCRLSITSCIYSSQHNDETGGVAHEFFLKNFFKNFSARLPKRMVQTVVVAKGEENRITRLCGREGR